MAKASSPGQTEASIRGTLSETTFRDLGFMNGPMAGNTTALGPKIKWKAQESSLGKMEESIKEIIKTIVKKDMGSLNGQTEGSIRVSGKMANNMEKAFL